ncbi:hypothetical protein TP70_10430 [Staphylococcus microti]|uniref:Uncharacterized protein n=1 Tax=Staphylococcus microti TaxID=569857 RepID=A0A0D6XMY5_9STAP|nr:hypothetical protein [Staphylococcus microti]KIX89972.1 hypothetical protein TP70_10430 [Staphylococcus microti]PNZ80186.1 hypothetical protein CD132_08380 [Staphylococcus microti]SUM57368.1 Uncharacterised protein [Staphylococcus microti]
MYVKYLDKKIKIVDIDNQIFIGVLEDIQRDYDAEEYTEELSVLLDNGVLLGITSNEIKSVKVI